MVVHKDTGKIEHKMFKDVLDEFDEGDVFVANDTKVFPAKLYGNKEKTGAVIEVFLLRELNRESILWDVLVDPARKIRIGNKLFFGENDELVRQSLNGGAADVAGEYARFEKLTSVHVNCDARHMLASGYSLNVRLYDVETAQVVREFHDYYYYYYYYY